MAPKAAMKRLASAISPRSTPRPTKRVAVAASDPVLGKCESVQRALEVATELPDAVRSMLSRLLPASLAIARDQRHAYQEQVVEWASDALRSVEAGLEVAVTEAEAAVASIEEERAKREAARSELEAQLQVLKTAAQERKDELAVTQGCVESASEALAAAQAAQMSGDEEFGKIAEKRKTLDSCKTSFLALRDGTVEAGQVEERSATVCAQAKDVGLNSSMLESLPSALRYEPEKRGGFTGLVLESFQSEADAILGELGARLEEMQPEMDARATAVMAAQGAFDAAKQNLEACKAAVKEASKAVVDCRQAGKDAAVAFAEHGPAAAKAESTLSAAKAKLAKFQGGPLQLCAQLRERTTPVPTPAVVDEPLEAKTSAIPPTEVAPEAPDEVASEAAMELAVDATLPTHAAPENAAAKVVEMAPAAPAQVAAWGEAGA